MYVLTTTLSENMAERAGFSAADVPLLELRWAFAFPEASEVRTKPTVVDGLALVGDEFGAAQAVRLAGRRPDGIRGLALGHASLSLSSDAPAALVGTDGTTLTTGETALSADTWRLAELLVQENGVALAIDGVEQFTFTAEAAHSA